MVVSLVQIGNSKGVRLPKAILEQLGIQEKLELDIEDKKLVLKPIASKPRAGWEAAFKQMSAAGDDRLLLPDADQQPVFEWEW